MIWFNSVVNAIDVACIVVFLYLFCLILLYCCDYGVCFRLVVFLFMRFILVFGLYGCCGISVVKLLLAITCGFGRLLGGFDLIVWLRSGVSHIFVICVGCCGFKLFVAVGAWVFGIVVSACWLGWALFWGLRGGWFGC